MPDVHYSAYDTPTPEASVEVTPDARVAITVGNQTSTFSPATRPGRWGWTQAERDEAHLAAMRSALLQLTSDAESAVHAINARLGDGGKT